MAAGLGFLTLADYRGGRNGADPLTAIPETQCAEAINVDWYRGMLARRRPGAAVVPGSIGLSRTILSLIRFVPGASEKQTQLFAFDRDGMISRFISGVGWATTSPGSLNPTGGIVHGVSFNRKLFLAGSNTSDKLHFYEASTNTIRTTGLTTPLTAPTVAPSGVAGSITGARFYKYRWVEKAGAITVRRSEMSPQAGLTVVSQTGWIITRGTTPTSSETHWELYGASAGESYYLLTTLPIGTASYTDTTAIASFPPPNSELAPLTGAYTPTPNGKYLLVDEARLLIAGSFTDPKLESRVVWTPVLNDASGDGNDERINAHQRPWIDFDPGDSGEITGMGGPLFDSPYVFKLDRVYKMVRTGLAQAAYRPVTVSKQCGALHQRTIVLAEDEAGHGAIYFLSRRGPYRVGVNGVQYCGRDIEDLWATVDLNAAAGNEGNAGAHGVYHADLHQVWWWVPTTLDCPTVKLVFDTRLGQFTNTDGVRRGWAQHTGASARAWCSEMFADAVSLPTPVDEDSLALKPYLSQAGTDPLVPDDDARVWMADTGHLDNGAGYQASVRSRAIALSETVVVHGGVLEGHVLLSPGAHTFTVSTIRDYGLEVRTTAPFTVVSSAVPRVLLPVRDLAAVSCAVVQIEYADSPTSEIWELDQIVLRIRKEEDR